MSLPLRTRLSSYSLSSLSAPLGPEQQDPLREASTMALHQPGGGQVEDPGEAAALWHAHLRAAFARNANKSCAKV